MHIIFLYKILLLKNGKEIGLSDMCIYASYNKAYEVIARSSSFIIYTWQVTLKRAHENS